ncbi:MAG: endonuclease III [Phycisphaerales bacterium]|nr:endonuclease III [Phycisphaerales bacterium]
MTLPAPPVPVQPGQESKAGFELPRKSADAIARAEAILAALYERYPDAHCELDYRSPHELLVATILSAQATDVAVNKATPALFEAFPTPAAYAAATAAEIEPFVRSLGFFRNKALAVHTAMTRVADAYGGKVPRTMEELLTLRGVARKTANVVLSNAFGINVGVVVDTHVMRLAKRFGLSRHADPARIERDLMALLPRPHWGMASHLLIWHGRRVCKARGGTCGSDPICQRFCSNAKAAPKKQPASRAGRARKAAATRGSAASSRRRARP